MKVPKRENEFGFRYKGSLDSSPDTNLVITVNVTPSVEGKYCSPFSASKGPYWKKLRRYTVSVHVFATVKFLKCGPWKRVVTSECATRRNKQRQIGSGLCTKDEQRGIYESFRRLEVWHSK